MSECFVYVIGNQNSLDGPHKIGVAANPSVRLQTFQTACPYPLAVKRAIRLRSRDDAMRVERAAHSMLSPHRAHGEWFDVGFLAAEYNVFLAALTLCFAGFSAEWPSIASANGASPELVGVLQ